MEILCINGTFHKEILLFYQQHGVSVPIEDKIYNIREVIKHTHGSTGVRLEEIKNPQVPINHPILGSIMTEPTFDIKRFAKLNGSEITKEEIEIEVAAQISLNNFN